MAPPAMPCGSQPRRRSNAGGLIAGLNLPVAGEGRRLDNDEAAPRDGRRPNPAADGATNLLRLLHVPGHLMPHLMSGQTALGEEADEDGEGPSTPAGVPAKPFLALGYTIVTLLHKLLEGHTEHMALTRHLIRLTQEGLEQGARGEAAAIMMLKLVEGRRHVMVNETFYPDTNRVYKIVFEMGRTTLTGQWSRINDAGEDPMAVAAVMAPSSHEALKKQVSKLKKGYRTDRGECCRVIKSIVLGHEHEGENIFQVAAAGSTDVMPNGTLPSDLLAAGTWRKGDNGDPFASDMVKLILERLPKWAKLEVGADTDGEGEDGYIFTAPVAAFVVATVELALKGTYRFDGAAGENLLRCGVAAAIQEVRTWQSTMIARAPAPPREGADEEA